MCAGSPLFWQYVLNYENQLINKYEAWEERLDQRQEAIEAKEKELGIMPE